MDMRKTIVREIGQCTQCGIDATHANECVTCHCATLSVAVIKNVFNSNQIRSVTESLVDANLIADAKDIKAPGNVRRVASTITRLAFANGLQVHDLKHRIISRLRETCDQVENETEQSKAEYIGRIMDWLKTVTFKLCKP